MSSKVCNKLPGFDFGTVDFLIFMNAGVLRSSYCRFYMSQLVQFGRTPSHGHDSNVRNKILTAKLLKQGMSRSLTFNFFFFFFFQIL